MCGYRDLVGGCGIRSTTPEPAGGGAFPGWLRPCRVTADDWSQMLADRRPAGRCAWYGIQTHHLRSGRTEMFLNRIRPPGVQRPPP